MAAKSVSEISNRTEIDLGNGKSSMRVQGNLTVSSGTPVKVTHQQDLSIAPLQYSISSASNFRVIKVAVTFSNVISETITFKDNFIEGTDEDGIIVLQDLELNKSMVWKPDNGYYVFGSGGDTFDISVTNSTSTETAYVTAVIEVI